MIYGTVGILFALAAFSLWSARRKRWDEDQGWDREWHDAWEDIVDAPVCWSPETAANLEEEQINKEFEKLRKRLKKEYRAKDRR